MLIDADNYSREQNDNRQEFVQLITKLLATVCRMLSLRNGEIVVF